MKRKTLAYLSLRIGVPTVIVGALALWILPSGLLAITPRNVNWPNHGNDLANTRFQNIDQITPANAGTLAPAWVFHTGVLDPLAELQVSPIVINGRMFVTDGHDEVFALRADDGTVMWRFATTDPDSYAGNSYKTGGAAVWNPPAIDRDLGLVYVVTGNAAPDILGQMRTGDNLFATSIVALSLTTGEPKWHFQCVHHDIWDYDSAQPPVLFPAKGRKALGHCSKNGQYYILDRSNGAPLFPVAELPVPAGPEFQHASPTQPYSAVEPLTPLTFVRPN